MHPNEPPAQKSQAPAAAGLALPSRPEDGPEQSSQPAAATLRGLAILKVTLVISLCASFIGGAARTYLVDLIMNHPDSRGSGGLSQPLLSGVLGAWQLVSIGTAVAELMALLALAGASAAARVGGLARLAFGLRAAELLMDLFTAALPYLMSSSFDDARQLAQLVQLVGYVNTAVGLIGTLVLIEVLLRLRQFAAPADPAIAESEGLLRAGLWGVTLSRVAVGYASYILVPLFGLGGSVGQWVGFAARVPLSLLYYGLFLWLVQATATALRARPLTEVVSVPSAAAPDSSAAAYRNMLLGALWAALGLGLSFVTYENAHQLGGRYVIAYGAVLAGIVQFLRGAFQLSGRR